MSVLQCLQIKKKPTILPKHIARPGHHKTFVCIDTMTSLAQFIHLLMLEEKQAKEKSQLNDLVCQLVSMFTLIFMAASSATK